MSWCSPLKKLQIIGRRKYSERKEINNNAAFHNQIPAHMTDRQWYVESSWHSSQDGSVDILGSVGGPHDYHTASMISSQAVPLLQELGLHHGRGFMVSCGPYPQEGVCGVVLFIYYFFYDIRRHLGKNVLEMGVKSKRKRRRPKEMGRLLWNLQEKGLMRGDAQDWVRWKTGQKWGKPDKEGDRLRAKQNRKKVPTTCCSYQDYEELPMNCQI